MQHSSENIRLQRNITVLAVILFVLKIVAWLLTNSVAILTDALESVVNVVAGGIGLFSLIISARPKDSGHPYGHGKAEFISAAFEGICISLAGLFIIYKGVYGIFHPQLIKKLDLGILLIFITGLINFLMSIWCERRGRKNESAVLKSSAAHLRADSYTTIGLVAGLLLLRFTNISWIDSAVAIFFACVILVSGFTIIRAAISGIMDEADELLLSKVVDTLNANRRTNWIDLHNMRIIKYGSVLHIDCHLTVPWYFNVTEAHAEIDELEELVRVNYGESLELFVHSDDCKPSSCAICSKFDCTVRKQEFLKTIVWTKENIRNNGKHHIGSQHGGA